MTPGIEQMLIAAGATAGGILAAAWFGASALRWNKTRAWGEMATMALIAFFVGVNIWLAARAVPGASMSGFLLTGSFLGALLTIRAIFGLVRYSRGEDGGSTTYRGSLADILLVCAAFVPIFLMMYLAGDF